MSIFEYDEEKELALMREDEYNAGVEAGIKEGKEEVAVRMLTAGTYSVDEISDVSGLPVETISRLKTEKERDRK